MKRKGRATKRTPGPAGPTASPVALIEERGLPIVSELDRVARSPEPPAIKLQSALDVLFRAYGEADPDFSRLLLRGWLRARDDKLCRLTLAWHHEQLRLSLAEILAEGVAQGAFRPGLDSGAVAAVILSAVEGCLLQSGTEGGAVTTAEVARAVLGLALNGA